MIRVKCSCASVECGQCPHSYPHETNKFCELSNCGVKNLRVSCIETPEPESASPERIALEKIAKLLRNWEPSMVTSVQQIVEEFVPVTDDHCICDEWHVTQACPTR